MENGKENKVFSVRYALSYAWPVNLTDTYKGKTPRRQEPGGG